MNDIVVLALIAGGMPILSVVVNRWWDSKDRRELYLRQDIVAKKVDEAASLLFNSNKEVSEQTREVNGKLDIIHTLVNSNMTAAMQGEYDSTAREIVSLKGQVILLHRSNAEIPEEINIAIKVAETRLNELKEEIEERLSKTV